MTKRSIVYIDGFNLYYGALRGTSNKWLDLESYFRRLRPDDDIELIRYFSALTKGASKRRQQTYLRALATTASVEVILGKFKSRRIFCRVPDCTFEGRRHFHAPEEKRTDVNIAIWMVDDAYNDRADRFILVSGDSDLVPPLSLIKSRFPEKELIVYVPARSEVRGAATELRAVSDRHRTLPNTLLARSQFAALVPDGSGGKIEKPEGW